MAKTVHVVAWEYNGGSGGFWWYPSITDANDSWLEEIENVNEFGGTAYRFDYLVSANATPDEITTEIDGDLIGLCDRAEIRHSKDVIECTCDLCHFDANGISNTTA